MKEEITKEMMNRLEGRFLEMIFSDYTFVPTNEIGEEISLAEGERSGVLWVQWNLSSLRRWVELPSNLDSEDALLLQAIQGLAEKGLIKIFEVSVDKMTPFHDCNFFAQIGVAKRMGDNEKSKVEIVRLYKNVPLTKEERKSPHTILNVIKRVANIRKIRDFNMGQRVGTRDFSIEKKLNKEEIEGAAEIPRAIKNIEKLLKNV